MHADHLISTYSLLFDACTHYTSFYFCMVTVAFKIYDIDRDGYISNGELFQVLKMMVGNNLKDGQLQQIVDKTIIYSDKDGDGRISYDEFCAVSISSSGTAVVLYLTLDPALRLYLFGPMCILAVTIGHNSLLVFLTNHVRDNGLIYVTC